MQYAFFFSFPVVFGPGGYGFNDGIAGLMFISVIVGLALALCVMPLVERNYRARAAAKGGQAEPEDRLVGMMIGCWFVPVCTSPLRLSSHGTALTPRTAMFIFGWTSPPYVPPGGARWAGPCLAGVPFGFGMVIIYFSANAYLIDAFPGYVASALAAKTVVRSGAGAAMPLFITAMYHNIGNGWAASTWGFVSLAMVRLLSLLSALVVGWRAGADARSVVDPDPVLVLQVRTAGPRALVARGRVSRRADISAPSSSQPFSCSPFDPRAASLTHRHAVT